MYALDVVLKMSFGADAKSSSWVALKAAELPVMGRPAVPAVPWQSPCFLAGPIGYIAKGIEYMV